MPSPVEAPARSRALVFGACIGDAVAKGATGDHSPDLAHSAGNSARASTTSGSGDDHDDDHASKCTRRRLRQRGGLTSVRQSASDVLLLVLLLLRLLCWTRALPPPPLPTSGGARRACLLALDWSAIQSASQRCGSSGQTTEAASSSPSAIANNGSARV